jgi:hypothetical protein
MEVVRRAGLLEHAHKKRNVNALLNFLTRGERRSPQQS